MTAATEAMRPPSRALLFMEGRALWELGAFVGSLPLLNAAPRGDGHPVLVLPGLIASDVSTRPLRAFLRGRGYAAHGWGLGRNLGPREGVEDGMRQRLLELHQRYGRKVSLIGWSLGGVFARELAKQDPKAVRQVITLGSPFAGDPRATNAWRVFEWASGQKVPERGSSRIDRLRQKPPVPSTAIYSRTDGICAWQACREDAGPQADNIEIMGSHCGLGHNPAAVYAIADRLAQPEDGWKPFSRGGWKRAVYLDPERA
jgi:pimeloyl-ACP methyl ester carboxylesterase